MPKIIEVPDVGPLEFPDDMTDDQIGTAIREDVYKLPSLPPMAEYDEKIYKDRRFISESNLKAAESDLEQIGETFAQMSQAVKTGQAAVAEEDIIKAQRDVKFSKTRYDMALQDAQEVGKDPAPLGRSAQASFASGILNTAAAVTGAASKLGSDRGEPARPEDSDRYAELLNYREKLRSGAVKPPTSLSSIDTGRSFEEEQARALPDEIDRVSQEIADIERGPRSETLTGQLRGAAADAFKNANINEPAQYDKEGKHISGAANPAAQIGRGIGTVGAFIPTLLMGSAGLPAAVLQMGGQTYQSAYMLKERELRDKGLTDERGINEEASRFASMKTAASMPEFATYMAGGKLASNLVGRMLPEASPLKRFFAGTAAATATNTGIAGAFRKWVHGEDFLPTLEQFTQDALFGAIQGAGEARGVAQQRRAGEAPVAAEIVPEAPAAEVPVTAETPVAEIPASVSEVAAIVPAIRVGGEVIRGEKGETHQDVLNRFKTENPEREVDALLEFDTKENPNFFVDETGAEISRAELQERFGVNDAQGLRDLQVQEPARNLGPGAANIEENLGGPAFTTSNKEAVVNAERAARQQDPVLKEAKITNVESIDRAEALLEQNPAKGDEIMARLRTNPQERTISLEDSAVLLVEKTNLLNRRRGAEETINDPNSTPEEIAEATERFNFIEGKIAEMDQAAQDARSTWGRFGQLWQRTMRDDYTLGAMEAKARAVKGELTPEDTAKIKQLSERGTKAQETLERRTEEAETGPQVDEAIRRIEAEATAADPEFTPEVKSLAERISNRLQKAADAALQRLRAKGFLQLGSAPDPTILADLVIYGAAKITKGALDFGRWGTSMIRDLGRGVEPYLKDIWTKANKRLDDDAAGTKKPREVKEALTKPKTVATVDEIAATMKGKKLSEVRGSIQKLVETLVRGGIKQRGPLVDAVHDVLKGVDPTITRRQTADAISGYGNFKPLNPDAVKAEVRDIKQQLQLVSKIEDVQAKIPLQKSGIERQKLSDESRRLTAELNENMKKFGVVVSDPATQLRTMLAAQETRLTNRIKDLRAEIESGTRRVKSKSERPSNEKIEALKKELAQVEAEHEAAFGKREVTPEQRAKAALSAAKRAEVAEQARLEKAKKGIFDKPIKTPAARTAEVEAIRARTEALREERKALEDVANPPLSKAQRALDSAMVERERLDQLLAGEIAPAKKMPREALTELEGDVRAEISAMRQLAAEIRQAEKPKADPEVARENAQVKALEKAAAEYERRLNEADFAGKGKTQGADTLRVSQARALRDAAKTALEAARKLANPPRTKEQIALQNFKALAARRAADLQDRIAKGDFAPRAKKPPLDLSKDPEAVKAKAELERVKTEFDKERFKWEQAQRSTLRKGIDVVKETLAASRSLITSADVSAPLRQGGFLLIGDLVFNPVRAAKQVGSMFRQLFSEKASQEAQAAIALRPNADLYQQSKLYFSDMDGKLSAREESMRSSLAEKIPVIGRIVRASNRAYSGFLNRQRADAFDAMIEARGGPSAVTPEGAKLIADAVNTLTGRGSIGAKNEGAANFLAKYLFSPRFLASRFQTVLGKPIFGALGKGASLADRRIVATQYAKFAVGLTAIYGLAMLAGGKVEKDPRSSDFGKIRFGDTRIDPLAGLAQVTVLMARTATGKTKTPRGIQPVKAETYYQFARSKLAPIPGALLDARTGKNVIGEKVTPGGMALGLTVPISYQDIGDIYEKHGPIGGTVLSVLNLLGASVNTYKKK